MGFYLFFNGHSSTRLTPPIILRQSPGQGACVCSAANGSVCPEYFAMLSKMHDQFGVAKQITDPLGRWTPLPTKSKAPKQGTLDSWSDGLGGALD